MIGNPGEDQSASPRADTRNPSWKEGRDTAGADARGGPGSPPYDRAFGTPHGVSAGAAREAAGLRRGGRTKELHSRRRRPRPHRERPQHAGAGARGVSAAPPLSPRGAPGGSSAAAP